MNRLEKFLQELSVLTQKHGFSIAGCGCCGSPWIVDFQSEFVAENLGYNQEKQKYEVDCISSPEDGGEE